MEMIELLIILFVLYCGGLVGVEGFLGSAWKGPFLGVQSWNGWPY